MAGPAFDAPQGPPLRSPDCGEYARPGRGAAGDGTACCVTEVYVGDSESFEGALKRFNKRVQADGILSEARRAEYYEKPSVRRKKKEAARLRSCKAMRAQVKRR